MARVGKSDFVVAWEKQPKAGTGPLLSQAAIASGCTGRLSPAPAALPLCRAVPHHCPCSSPRLQPFGQAFFMSDGRLARLFDRFVIYITSLALWKGKKWSDATTILNDLFLKQHTRPNETRDLGILVETPAA